MKLSVYLSLILFVFSQQPAAACTNISASRAGQVMVGQNWDWKNLDVYVWFEPAEKDAYGCFFYGLKVGYPSSGMNDQGLTISGALSPRSRINEIKGIKTVATALDRIQLTYLIYRQCATVEDVIEKIKTINLKFLETGHILVTDRTGASVIVENDGQGNLILFYRDKPVKMVPDRETSKWVEQDAGPLPPHLQKKTDYQVITNFLHSQLALKSRLGGYPSWRYDAAVRILENSATFTPEVIRDILKKTRLEAEYPTKLSTVYDLKTGDVSLYYLRNFRKAIRFNLEKELTKGKHSYDLRSLFKLRLHPLFVLCALILISAIFARPIDYTIRQLIKGKPPSDNNNRKKLGIITAVISGINSFLILILIYRFPYVLSHQIELVKYNLYEKFFINYGQIFFLILILTAVMILFTLLVWKKKYWSVPIRIHYSLVTVVSFTIIAILI